MIDAYSEIGMRNANQDAYLTASVMAGGMNVEVFHHNDLEKYETNSSLPDGTIILLVADGMGGLENGEKASYLTVVRFLDFIESNNDPTSEYDWTIEKSLLELSEDVSRGAPGAGSTIVGVVIIEGSTYVFNVGDSKCIIHARDEYITTKDHVYGEALQSNIITDYMGMEGQPNIHMEVYDYVIDNAILFSDGLNQSYICHGEDICTIDLGAKALCDESVEMGSTDNITCIKYSKI